MNNKISNHSKSLSRPDDSAGALLVELLEGTTGRNFDIESIFLERLETGEWRWVVYEFLKAETIPPQRSNPNYYWHKNSRKFLSLWALVCTLRKAGYLADLILVNYADNRSLGVKEMIVQTIDPNTSEVFREEFSSEGVVKARLMRHVVSKDTPMSFDEFKKKFRKFNDEKMGDTWEILSDLSVATIEYEHLAKKVLAAVAESGLEIHSANKQSPNHYLDSGNANRAKPNSSVTDEAVCQAASCGRNVTQKVAAYSKQHFAGKIYCMTCQKKHR